MQFVAGRLEFINRRDWDKSDFAGKIVYAAGGRVPVLWMQPPAGYTSNKVMVYFHGNAATLRSCHTILKKLRDRFKTHVMAMEYPSYGNSRSTLLTVRQVKQDARDFMHFVMNDLQFAASDIIITSFCMGCFVSFYVASLFKVQAFVAVAPLSSIQEYMNHGTRISAFMKLTPEAFDGLTSARKIFSPTLIVQGTKDTIATEGHVFGLFRNVGTTRKSFIRYTNEKHIMSWDKWVMPAIETFFREQNIDLHHSDRPPRPDLNMFLQHFEREDLPMWPVLMQHYGIWFAYVVVILLLIFKLVCWSQPDK